jgi:hypothetical protein
VDDLIAKIKARDDAYNEVEGTIALDDDYEQCAADRRALLGELAEAREALRVYGRHLDSCGDADSYNHAEIPSCGCGFDAFLAAKDVVPPATQRFVNAWNERAAAMAKEGER